MAHPPTRPEEGLFGEADSSYPDALPVMPEVGGGVEQSDHGLSQAQAKANNGDWLP